MASEGDFDAAERELRAAAKQFRAYEAAKKKVSRGSRRSQRRYLRAILRLATLHAGDGLLEGKVRRLAEVNKQQAYNLVAASNFADHVGLLNIDKFNSYPDEVRHDPETMGDFETSPLPANASMDAAWRVFKFAKRLDPKNALRPLFARSAREFRTLDSKEVITDMIAGRRKQVVLDLGDRDVPEQVRLNAIIDLLRAFARHSASSVNALQEVGCLAEAGVEFSIKTTGRSVHRGARNQSGWSVERADRARVVQGVATSMNSSRERAAVAAQSPKKFASEAQERTFGRPAGKRKPPPGATDELDF